MALRDGKQVGEEQIALEKGHATFGKSFEIWSDCLRMSFKDFIPIIPVVDVQKKDAGPVGIGRLR